MTFLVHVQREFRFVTLGRFTAVWLYRWPPRGWSFAGRDAGHWLLRFGPLVLAWG